MLKFAHEFPTQIFLLTLRTRREHPQYFKQGRITLLLLATTTMTMLVSERIQVSNCKLISKVCLSNTVQT